MKSAYLPTRKTLRIDRTNNTNDLEKPISDAAALVHQSLQTQINNLASGVSGSVNYATLDYVDTAIDNINGSPDEAVNTLEKLGLAIGNDPEFITTINTSIDAKADSHDAVFTGTTTGITKDMVGLSLVENLADIDRGVSSATLTLVNDKMDKSGGTFTGAVFLHEDSEGITQLEGDSSLLIATTEFVSTAISTLSTDIIDGAPTELNTLQKIAMAIEDDPDFCNTIRDLIATKLNLSGGTMTGALILHTDSTAVTQSPGNQTTKLATTEFTTLAIDDAVSDLVDGAPINLDTIGKLSTALNNDEAFHTTISDALDTKLNLSGGTMTGNLVLTSGSTGTTQTAGDNSGKFATTAFVANAIALLLSTAPSVLNDMAELAAALGNDPDFHITITNLISAKLPISGGTMTGALNLHTDSTAVTQTPGNQTTKIATTEFTTLAISEIIDDAPVDLDTLGKIATAVTTISDTLDDKLNLSGGTMTGNLVLTSGSTGTTQSTADSSTKLATTAYVQANLTDLLNSAPVGLNTLGEIATSIGNDTDFTGTMTTALGTKLNLSGGTMTGNLVLTSGSTGTTQSTADSSTKLATTAYVKANFTDLVNGAPVGLDTLYEIAASINNDTNFTGTMTTALGTKLNLSGGTMTGDLQINDNFAGYDYSTKAVHSKYVAQTFLRLAGGELTGGLVSYQHGEKISTTADKTSWSSNTLTYDGRKPNIYMMTELTSDTNFTVALTNVNSLSLTKVSYTYTFIIDATTYQGYCDTLTVNGNSVTLIHLPSAPTVTNADSKIVQSITIIYNSSSSTVDCAISRTICKP